MAGVNPLHSAKVAEHYTPKDIMDRVHSCMGGIDLDPCSSKQANKIVRATRYISDDGLAAEWHGRLFINPPGHCGGRSCDFLERRTAGKEKARCKCKLVQKFFAKLQSGLTRKDITQAIYVGYSMEQLATLQVPEIYHQGPLLAPGLCIPKKRIQFLNAKLKPQKSPTHGNFIAYYGFNCGRFYDAFRDIGEVRLP